MAKQKIELNESEVRKLLRSPEVEAELKRRADRIAAAAGDGFETESEVGPNRARAVVFTASFAAMQAEADDKALTRAIDAGR